MRSHLPYSLQVVQRVQPQPPRGACRAQQPVASFPGAQRLRADACSLAELTDPEKFFCGHVRHHYTRPTQTLDNPYTMSVQWRARVNNALGEAGHEEARCT